MQQGAVQKVHGSFRLAANERGASGESTAGVVARRHHHQLLPVLVAVTCAVHHQKSHLWVHLKLVALLGELPLSLLNVERR